MWEFNISVGNNFADALFGMENRLRPLIVPGSGIMIFDKLKDRSYLSLACGEDGKAPVVHELREAVSDIITVRFKENYLLRHSRLPKGNKINYNAFIRALVAFDREWDRELVLKNLRLQKELLLDGFFNFRLKELRAKWQEVCDLASNNSGYLEYHDTFIELLAFLVKTLDSKIDRVFVAKDGAGYLLLGADGGQLDRIKLGVDKTITDETLLPNLIHLAPKEVILQDCAVPEYVKNIMSSIFNTKAKN